MSLENSDMRLFATDDPNGFIKTFNNHIIIDEAGRVPSLFSYLQTHIDDVNEPGMYLLAGSRNFHLMAAIFYDTGLACSLLGIRSAEQIERHFLRGGLFENLVINQFIKDRLNNGIIPDLTFWRDSTSLEVDLIETIGMQQHGYEIKSGSTFIPSFVDGLTKWGELSGTPVSCTTVVYSGSDNLQTSNGNVIAIDSSF